MRKKGGLTKGMRPTWSEIDLRALAHNFSVARRLVGSDAKILVTVKADAYGHGIVPVAKHLVALGVDMLGVASVDEGIVLRKHGIKKPILILGLILPQAAVEVVRHDFIQTVCDEEVVRALDRAARVHGSLARVHVKIDTGMGRVGVPCFCAVKFLKRLPRFSHIRVEGIFTHFPKADCDPGFTLRQIRLFDSLIKECRDHGLDYRYRHAANSMGVTGYEASHYNLVRPGLMIYGLAPRSDLHLLLRPVMSLKSKIVSVRRFAQGCGISYGHTYVTPGPRVIAVVAIGYGDGYPRILSNKAKVIIRGKRVPIVGTICMDQLMVDVTGVKNVKRGDEVILIGSSKGAVVSVDELARLASTISYEIVCGIGSRVPRVYPETSKPLA